MPNLYAGSVPGAVLSPIPLTQGEQTLNTVKIVFACCASTLLPTSHEGCHFVVLPRTAVFTLSLLGTTPTTLCYYFIRGR